MTSRLLKPTAFKIASAIGLLFALVHIARSAVHQRFHFLDLLEEKAVDVKFTMRGPLPLSHKVALAGIDEKSIQRYGLWPWNRSLLAKAIANLDKAGAASIALDLAYTDPDRNTAFATLAKLKDKLPPPGDPAEGKALEQAAADPALASLVQSLKDRSLRLAELRTTLEGALAESPDQAMARAVEASADKLVLGTINAVSGDVAQFSPEVRQAWEHELGGSFIPGSYVLKERKGKHGTTYAFASDEIPPEVPLAVDHPEVLQAWLPDIAKGAKHFGYFTINEDIDGSLRHYTPVVRHGPNFYPSLGVAAVAAAYHSAIYPRRFNANRLGDVGVFTDGNEPVLLPVDPFFDGQMLIDYAAPNDRWRHAEDPPLPGVPPCSGATCDRISLSDAVDGTFDPKTVEDKIVFVGATAVGTFDQRVTPFDPFGPGVFVHLNVAEDIVANHFLDHPGWTSLIEALVMLLLGLLFGVVVPRLSLGSQVAAFPAGSAVFLGGNYLAFTHGHQLNTVTPVLELAALTFGVVFFQYMTTDKEKRQIRNTFQHYLSNSVMEEMLKDPTKLKLGGQKRELTVFFSDIRGFTTLSEMLQPDEVSKMLNEYLTPMTDLVFETNGTVDKYMGDAIMAFWGAPLDQPDHALRACQTSVAMLKKLDLLRAGWKAQGKPDIDIGIGLNSGMISVGNMGSHRMFNYTVIGDDVNLASRLEGTNKTYGTRIILGENTYRKVQGKVVARELGGVMVKGKKKPVTIFELREMGEPSPEEAATIALFEKGLAHYRARQWDEAEACLKQVQAKWPGDGPSEKYLDDIEDKRQHPPAEGWDGVYVMKTK